MSALQRFKGPQVRLEIDVHPGVKEIAQGLADDAGVSVEAYVAGVLQEWTELQIRKAYAYAEVLAEREGRGPDHASAARKRERSAMRPSLRLNVLKRDNFRCRYCGVSVQDGAKLHADHIVPVIAGGKTVLENLQTLCEPCNLAKAKRPCALSEAVA